MKQHEKKKQLHLSILKRDRFTCKSCSGSANVVDHILPKSKGGSDEPGNLAALCDECNSCKGSYHGKEITERITKAIDSILIEKKTSLLLCKYELSNGNLTQHEYNKFVSEIESKFQTILSMLK